ncbi:hypothetical protein ACCAA_30041 [Candidatus Accumulibacter aalborgensis]|uniref:Uncharacterized protein n=1 Tax=Candidatus Accumulibacter aalborgensis TaxID=1860102 RepID=A0A1A8XN77_9PROT|nr:hypothetical protein ACCAA_30041 [Candidatus Accumulibacter aalborgensis]
MSTGLRFPKKAINKGALPVSLLHPISVTTPKQELSHYYLWSYINPMRLDTDQSGGRL